MKFEWDESKKISNLEKYGISFEEAKTLFDNPLAVIFDDPQQLIEVVPQASNIDTFGDRQILINSPISIELM